MKLPQIFFSKIVIAVQILVFSQVLGCRPRLDGSYVSGRDARARRPAWMKSPEAIAGSIEKAWGISMTDEERWRYLWSIYSIIGGTQVATGAPLNDKPTPLLVLGLDNLSNWLAQKLVEKQATVDGTTSYLFQGLGSGRDENGCFEDSTQEWCDFDDEITVASLSQAGVTVGGIDKAWRKRLMHNVQDMGEFFFLKVDNEVEVPGSTSRHAPEYLINEVFVPALGEGTVTANREAEAWSRVVYNILMSGGFFFDVAS